MYVVLHIMFSLYSFFSLLSVLSFLQLALEPSVLRSLKLRLLRDVRAVDQVEKVLPVAEQVPPIHEPSDADIGRVIELSIVAERDV